MAISKEMIRVAKSGGFIVCIEQDQHSAMLATGFGSLPELEIDEELALLRGILLFHRGRIKLGHGGDRIAPRIPVMLSRLGLKAVDLRLNDLPDWCKPPYDSQDQHDNLNKAKRFYLNTKGYQRWTNAGKEAFLAGGGSAEEHAHYSSIIDRQLEYQRRQLESRAYANCHSSRFYVIK